MSLRPFIRWLLMPLELQPATLDTITDDEGMRLFARAFTSASADPRFDHNYERLEFVGDTLVNDAVASYVYRRFPWTQAWMTLIKHHLVQTKGLGRLAENLRFLDHVRMDAAQREEVAKNDAQKYKLLEDVFEAFIGALREVWVLKQPTLCPAPRYAGMGAMLGTALAEELIFAYLDAPNLIRIETAWDVVKDAKTRVQELYMREKWGSLKQVLHTRAIEAGPRRFFRASLSAWPHGRHAQPQVWHHDGATKQEAEQGVARTVLHELAQKYGIAESVPPKQHSAKIRKR